MKLFLQTINVIIIKILLLYGFFLQPVYAGGGPMFSLNNTDFVVLIAFLVFIGILLYLKVPSILATFLDKRALGIREEIDSANKILEDSKTLLADLEREHKINIQKAERIIIEAENEAKNLVNEAKKDIKSSISRKISLAEEQIKTTEKAIIKNIRNRAVDLSIELAEEKLKKLKNASNSNLLIERSIETLKRSLN